ncbi:hypothetical protein [Streptomyces sp. NPDC003952]
MSIAFGPGVKFGSFNFAEMRRFAADTDNPMWLRIWFLAMADANRLGHAEYGPTELPEILNTTPATVRKAIREAKARELIRPESKSRCVVVSTLLRKTSQNGSTCTTHGIHPAARRIDLSTPF